MNPAWESLAALHGWRPGIRFTKAESGRVGAALKDIREASGMDGDALAAAIRGRIAAYRRRWPGMECTATAIAAHWNELAPPEGGEKRAEEIRKQLYSGGIGNADYMQRLREELEMLTP